MKILLGKPKIQYCRSVNGVPDGNWVLVDTPRQDSTSLETSEGSDIEAREEGGEVVERLGTAATYTLTFELFKKKNVPMLFSDIDVSGVVPGEYAFWVMSDIDSEAPSFRIDRAIVKTQKMYAPNDTYRTQFSVMALKPAEGDTIKDLAYVDNGDATIGSEDYTVESLRALTTPLAITSEDYLILNLEGDDLLGVGGRILINAEQEDLPEDATIVSDDSANEYLSAPQTRDGNASVSVYAFLPLTLNTSDNTVSNATLSRKGMPACTLYAIEVDGARIMNVPLNAGPAPSKKK